MTPLARLAGARCDVLVAGAGPAGALAALGFARRGLRVLLADRQPFPRYKVCGCCLNPRALATLERCGLGELPERCGAVPLHGFRVAAGGRCARWRLHGWLGLSRERLDDALAAAAAQAGATFLPHTIVHAGAVAADGISCTLRRGDEIIEWKVGMLVAAGGLGGLVDRDEFCIERGSKIGAGVVLDDASAHYPPGQIHMACGAAGYLGLVRLEDGRLNLAAALDAGQVRRTGGPGRVAARLLDENGWPIPDGLVDAPWRGTAPLTRRARRPGRERLLMVGDAAGYVEPFTGEGMGWALAAAEALVALAPGGWRPGLDVTWTSWYRRTAPRRQRLIRAAAWVLRNPTLARISVGLAEFTPRVAESITQVLYARAATSEAEA